MRWATPAWAIPLSMRWSTVVDESGPRNDPQLLFNNIPITNIYDYNRDGSVNSSDEAIARTNPTNPTDAVKYISVWPPTTVVARKLFYAGSTRYNVTNGMFPGNSDDNAIAADKVALLPGAGRPRLPMCRAIPVALPA